MSESEFGRNDPRAFAAMSEVAQATLLEWIRLAAEPAKTPYRFCHSLPQDFADAGFYVTNGQFRGAMLKAGYRPTLESSASATWSYHVRPKCPLRCFPDDRASRGRFGLWHLRPERRAEFDRLLAAAMEEEFGA